MFLQMLLFLFSYFPSVCTVTVTLLSTFLKQTL